MLSRSNTLQNTLPIGSSSLAFLLQLGLIPLVRIVPERPDFFIFYALLVAITALAIVGIASGLRQFKKTREPISLAAFFLGQLVLALFVLYSLAPLI